MRPDNEFVACEPCPDTIPKFIPMSILHKPDPVLCQYFTSLTRARGSTHHSGMEKIQRVCKKNQVLEIVGAKGGNRTPTGITPQEPEY